MERSEILNSLFVNGIYGKSIGKAKSPSGNKELLEILANLGIERKFHENFSLNINLTSSNQIQSFENFSDTSNYLRLNFGIKNKIFNNLSVKTELIYDIDLNSRIYNQKYMYGIFKIIYDYKDFSIISSINSISIIYNKSLFQVAISSYLRPDYNVPIFNLGLGFRK
ncbi:MAG: hypothetical protein ABIL37_03950 [candidate division WOR-3 bacterium]